MTQLRLDGRVAIVTGAGGGLGAAHAAELAGRGAMVVVNDLGTTIEGEGSDRSPAQEQVDRIVAAGGKAVANFEDVSSPDGAARIVRHAIQAFGRIDIIVNNAGNFVPDCPLEQTTPERLDRLWRVHVHGTLNVIRAAWPHFVTQGYGRIINTASQAGYLGVPSKYEYDMVKMAIHGLTKTLALETGDSDIRVNSICPAAHTRPLKYMADSSPDVKLPDAFFQAGFAPELVSPLVAWLSHDECHANGEIFMSMSGTVTRMLVGETHGYFSAGLTAEQIRENFEQIMDMGDLSGTRLVIPGNAIERAAEILNNYTAHAG